MAHKKGVGSSRNGRDSQSKRLGVKRSDGQYVLARNDRRPPARHAVLGRNERRNRQGSHDLRQDRRCREFEPVARTKRRISVYPTDLVANRWCPDRAAAGSGRGRLRSNVEAHTL